MNAESDSAYSSMCFVVMPFGKREIDGTEIDFDEIYRSIFDLAIRSVRLPEGGNLIPKRADTSSISGMLTDEIFQDLLYSRIVLTDITGLNANVFYELGVRHALRPTSTVVIKDDKTTIPFDISSLRIIKYDLEGLSGFSGAIEKIQRSLTESLENSSPSSPVASALREDLEWPIYDPSFRPKHRIQSWVEIQKISDTVEQYMRDARISVERDDLDSAIAYLRGARALKPDDLAVNMQLATLLKSKGTKEDMEVAKDVLQHATSTHPMFATAWRELGIIEHKRDNFSEAQDCLLRATQLNQFDGDAWSSLGGVWKTLQDYSQAQAAYRKALDLSPRNTYAFLNYLALLAVNKRSLPDLSEYSDQLKAAASLCQSQILAGQNLPWSLYDRALLHFLSGETNEFKETIIKALDESTAQWQISTARRTYLLLDQHGNLPEAKEAIQRIDSHSKSQSKLTE